MYSISSKHIGEPDFSSVLIWMSRVFQSITTAILLFFLDFSPEMLLYRSHTMPKHDFWLILNLNIDRMSIWMERCMLVEPMWLCYIIEWLWWRLALFSMPHAVHTRPLQKSVRCTIYPSAADHCSIMFHWYVFFFCLVWISWKNDVINNSNSQRYRRYPAVILTPFQYVVVTWTTQLKC